MRDSTVRTTLPSSQLMLLSQSMCTDLPCAASSATTVNIADYSRNATLYARGVTVAVLDKRLQVLRTAMVEAHVLPKARTKLRPMLAARPARSASGPCQTKR